MFENITPDDTTNKQQSSIFSAFSMSLFINKNNSEMNSF